MTDMVIFSEEQACRQNDTAWGWDVIWRRPTEKFSICDCCIQLEAWNIAYKGRTGIPKPRQVGRSHVSRDWAEKEGKTVLTKGEGEGRKGIR